MLNGSISGEYVYYHDDATNADYRNDVDDLDYLAELLDSDDAGISADAYSHWCAGSQGEVVRHMRQRDIDALEFRQMPQDGGQIVNVSYATDDEWLYCSTHDRSDNSRSITCQRLDYDVEEDATGFEPQNGLLPDTRGAEIIVVTE